LYVNLIKFAKEGYFVQFFHNNSYIFYFSVYLLGVKMSDFVIGIPIGIAIGIAIGVSIGIALGKKQKPWSDMTEEEKRIRKIIIGVAMIFLIIGVLVNLWFFFR